MSNQFWATLENPANSVILMMHNMAMWYARKVEMVFAIEAINTFWGSLILLFVTGILVLIVYLFDDIVKSLDVKNSTFTTMKWSFYYMALWATISTLICGLVGVLQKYNSFDDLSFFMVVAGIVTSIILICIFFILVFSIRFDSSLALDIVLGIFKLAAVGSMLYYLCKTLYFVIAGNGYRALLVLCSTGNVAILLCGLLITSTFMVAVFDD